MSRSVIFPQFDVSGEFLAEMLNQQNHGSFGTDKFGNESKCSGELFAVGDVVPQPLDVLCHRPVHKFRPECLKRFQLVSQTKRA
jgi:hypothetical protein